MKNAGHFPHSYLVPHIAFFTLDFESKKKKMLPFFSTLLLNIALILIKV